jgi:hypothetical protein
MMRMMSSNPIPPPTIPITASEKKKIEPFGKHCRIKFLSLLIYGQ